MNYLDLYSSYPNRVIVGAWDSRVQHGDDPSWLVEFLPEHGSDMFSRVAACYTDLRALPRNARRALQRRLAHSTELARTLPEWFQQGGRELQHRLAWSLAGAALLMVLSQGIATAATITVTTDNPNIVADGQCSLIEAIVNANNDAATHSDCDGGSGADTIVLPMNANITLNAIDNNFSGPIGLPVITSRITIEGNGAGITRQAGAPDFGLMAIGGNFSQLPSHGNLTLQSVTLSGGSSGISNLGTLTIQNSIISGNTHSGMSNIGGIVSIKNSTISGNTGGGVFNSHGTLTIENSTITGNTADYGGGVANFDTATITNSIISGNIASTGGGLSNTTYCYFPFGCKSASLIIENSTISHNHASQGGGVSNTVFCFGYDSCPPAFAIIQNSTVSGNTAHRGGGIFNSSRLAVSNNNFSGNSANYGSDVFNPLSSSASRLATGEVGVFFTSDSMISGGVAPYIVSITKGKLPAGLSLGNDGIISGTPSPNAKSATITVRVTDALNESVTQNISITVVKAVRIEGKAKAGRVGRDYRAFFKNKGGVGPLHWSITSGALPSGLSFDTTTGAITGIPEQAGEFPLTVQVTDGLGGTDSENLALRIR